MESKIVCILMQLLSGKRYHLEDQYGAHRSKDGTIISLVDKSLAEVNDRLFQMQFINS